MGSGFDVDVKPEQVGIIPRAIEHLFNGIHDIINNAQMNGIPPPEFKISTQFMELYNEELIDLYNPIYNKVSKLSCRSYTGVFLMANIYILQLFQKGPRI